MRALMAALAALLLMTGTAEAIPGYYTPFTKTPRDSTRLHVMWVIDDFAQRNNTSAANNLAQLDALYSNVETVKARLEALGLEVHVYSYTQLASDLRLWRRAGGTRSADGFRAAGTDDGGYGIAIGPYWWLEGPNTTARLRGTGPNGGPLALRRFILPDSTSTHMLFFGGCGHLWRENNSSTASDSALGVQVNASAGPLFFLGNPYPYAVEGSAPPFAPTAFGFPADSLFGSYMPYMRTITTGFSALSGHQSIKYFKHPRGVQSSDSVFTIGAAADTFVCAWKLKSTGTGKYTDFVISSDGQMTGVGIKGNADVLWALLGRHVRVPPTVVSMEIADFFEWGYNPRYRYTRTDPSVRVSAPNTPSKYSWLGNYMHPRPSWVQDTLFTTLSQYNVNKKVLGTSGDSLKWYRDNSAPWAAMLARWAADPNIRVFMHDHDKADTNVTRLGTPFGIGQWAADTGTTAGAVFAFQRSPFMLRRVINRNDSLVSALGFKVEKFLLLGADRFVPMGAFDYTSADAAKLCPAESLMASLVACGYKYVTNFAHGESNTSGTAMKRSVQSYEGRVQNPTLGLGHRWPLLAAETYRPASGGEIRFEQYNAVFSSDSAGTGPFMLTQLVGGAQGLSITSLGLNAYSARNYEPATLSGQTTAGAYERPWGWGRVRVFGYHTEYLQAQPEVGFSPELYSVLAFLKRVKTLERIAGHQLLEWGFPSEAFEAP